MNGPDAFSIMAQAELTVRRQEEEEWQLSRRPVPTQGPQGVVSAGGATGAHPTWRARMRAALADAAMRCMPSAIRSRLALPPVT